MLWFSVLVLMADQLNQLGFIPWLSQLIAHSLHGLSKISFHVKTPVSNSNANAINAVNVASTWIRLPVTHGKIF
jgi:di/tricarboxylate transporter